MMKRFGKVLVLDDLYIREAFRGKGHGKEVIEYLLNYARDKGYKRLQFQSEFTNTGAAAFYRSIGFSSVEMHFYVKYL